MRFSHVAGGFFLFTAMVTIGCGASLHNVEGTVTQKGSGVSGATVSFVNATNQSFSGFTDDSGKFKLNGPSKGGIPPGEYKVTVFKSAAEAIEITEKDPTKAMLEYKKLAGKDGGKKASKTALPEEYSRVDKTPLKATVPSSGPIELKIESK
jgi:hypothetical protein